MLDAETKRRIDTARDVLVGKVPDPKSQVEQITIALIYKFMDDMDRESVQMGGKPSFFTGEYKKYAWTKMFDPKLGGQKHSIFMWTPFPRCRRTRISQSCSGISLKMPICLTKIQKH